MYSIYLLNCGAQPIGNSYKQTKEWAVVIANNSITPLLWRAQRTARTSEIIVWATDHDTNNRIGRDPTAQRGILTPASLTVKTQ